MSKEIIVWKYKFICETGARKFEERLNEYGSEGYEMHQYETFILGGVITYKAMLKKEIKKQ